ncbi:MAG: LutB/LldF family L-lactate oxidation iron-sulfur protein [Bacteroidota bacterium]
MASNQDKFLHQAEVKSKDKVLHKKLLFNIGQYDKKVVEGKKQYANLELAKERASNIKWKVVDNLDKYLLEFEFNFSKRGGKVIWAQDGDEAVKEIMAILKKANTKIVVKGKSITTEEIHLNETLEKNNIEPCETDLGEYIVQLRKEPPYHIVTPAMHLSKEDVGKLFNEQFQLPETITPTEVMAFVRARLREKYLAAEVGITGANFLIADTGSVAVTENEGNAFMSFAFPKIHIVIVGIEKIIPSITDLDLFLPLLATHGTGQNITVYNTIVSGPRQADETDGPEEMYVVLLDNGRSTLLEHTEQRQALSCIRCGACLNACPIYQNIGGHSYGVPYTGPIGSVIEPHMAGMKEFKHLSFASSLCGKCTEVCPVKIDIHNQLLHNRRDAVAQDLTSSTERYAFKFWKSAMLKRKNMNGGATLKNFMLNNFFKKQWGEGREMPKIATKSFNEQWREKFNIKS